MTLLAELHPRRVTHRLALSIPGEISQAWRIASNTEQANARAGLPAITYRDEPQPGGTCRRFFSYRLKGLEVVGEELPFSWEFPKGFVVHRVYSRGPFQAMTHRCLLVEEGTSISVTHTFSFVPRGLIGKIFCWGFGREVLPGLTAWHQEQSMNAVQDGVIQPHSGNLPEVHAVRTRLTPLLETARSLHASPALDHLARFLETGSDLEIERLRPLALARTWGTDSRDTLNTFLGATRAGITNLRWDVICPHCRGDKAHLSSLAEVKGRAFCPSCNLDFEVDLHRTLEAVFVPHPQVREVEVARHCLGGPGTTPHILYQIPLDPGEEATLPLWLPTGTYRIRFAGLPRFRWIRASEGVALPPSPSFTLLPSQDIHGDDLHLPSRTAIPLKVGNGTTLATVASVESVEWATDCLPAGELMARQRFRDLFSQEMLAPGVTLAVESVSILFTDVVASTAMYESLGDAKAFHRVWDHFSALREVVDNHRGGMVKTIGDAVMAVFSRPDDAVLASLAMHRAMAAAPAGLTLKIGIHEGPCIAVTLNDRPDYFGTTVNLAARIQSSSPAGAVVISRKVGQKPGMEGRIREEGWSIEEGEIHAKGFDAPVPVWSLRPPRSAEKVGDPL